MIIAWSHTVCFCRKPLAPTDVNRKRLGVRPAAEHHRECAGVRLRRETVVVACPANLPHAQQLSCRAHESVDFHD
jgi:hypothetical protein